MSKRSSDLTAGSGPAGTWRRGAQRWLAIALLLAVLSAGAGLEGAKVGCAMLGTTAVLLAVRMYRDCAAAMAAVLAALRKMNGSSEVLVA
jgi:hypothetical protein